jgi:crotonobetainyl-CoA:carnitine CoA-transferase CaiB-like acyl-CoA transferase
MSGLMSTTGEPDRKPSRTGASVVDYCTGSHAAVAIMMALWHRNRTGEGNEIEVPLLDVAATFMGFWYTYADRFDRVPERMGHTWELNAGSGFFETADGAIYLTFGSTPQWHRLCRELDREGWTEDERFDTLDGRNEHRETLHRMLDEVFSEYTTEEAVELCLDAHVPAAEYHTVPEAATNEHLQSRETVTTVEDTDGECVKIGAHPFRFPDSSLPDLTGPPRPGEDTRAVLTELDYAANEISNLVSAEVVSTEEKLDE